MGSHLCTVTHGGDVVGVLTLTDVLQRLLRSRQPE